MSIFNLFQKSIVTEPTFLKADTSAESQLLALEELLTKTPADSQTYLQIQQDIKMLKAGISGEKNVEYELRASFMPIFIFHDLFLQYKDLTAQIDYLVIHKNFILVIECKKMLGDIEITAKGDFIRIFKTEQGRVYKKEGIYSPIVQNERHCEILKKLLLEMFPKTKEELWNNAVKSVVVVANPKSVVLDKYAKKEVKEKIIKHDQLKQYLQSLAKQNADLFILKNESMQRICDTLLQMHCENPKDYTEKYREAVETATNKKEADTSEQSLQDKEALRTALKQYRLETSRKEEIKPYYIFNNAQMEDIILLNPASSEDLMQVKGFAELKCQKYGKAIIDILKQYQ